MKITCALAYVKGRPVISSERASDHLQPIEDTTTQELPFEETDKDE